MADPVLLDVAVNSKAEVHRLRDEYFGAAARHDADVARCLDDGWTVADVSRALGLASSVVSRSLARHALREAQKEGDAA